MTDLDGLHGRPVTLRLRIGWRRVLGAEAMRQARSGGA